MRIDIGLQMNPIPAITCGVILHKDKGYRLPIPIPNVRCLHTADHNPSVMDTFKGVRCLDLKPYFAILDFPVGRKMEHCGVAAVFAQTRPLQLVPTTEHLAFKEVYAHFLDHMLTGAAFAVHILTLSGLARSMKSNRSISGAIRPASPSPPVPSSEVGRIEERSDDAPAVRGPRHQGKPLPERRFAWSGLRF